MTSLDCQFLAAEARDAEAMEDFGSGISSWEPRLAIRSDLDSRRIGEKNRTVYALLMDGATELRARGHREPMARGDMAVIAPGLIVESATPADFLIFAYDGPAPEHFSADAAHPGFEVHRMDLEGRNRSICGVRSEVIQADDLRYRIQYHFVEIEKPQLHTHADMVEFYYVLYGSGKLSIGPDRECMDKVKVKQGDVIAVGPHLYHPASDGLGMAIVFLYDEATHEARRRERKLAAHGA